MSRSFTDKPKNFYLTREEPCPYLPDRMERKVFTHLNEDGEDQKLFHALTEAGFRRSQSVVYRPACETCKACMSARIRVCEFEPRKRHRRTLKRNADLHGETVQNVASAEQYALFERYLASRHASQGMDGMSFGEYAIMLRQSPVTTHMVEYRGADGALVACALVDAMHDGASLVYSFFDPKLHSQSLGSFVILDHIQRLAARAQRYLYLGYWVEGSVKMDYKADFQPLEVLTLQGWRDHKHYIKDRGTSGQ